MANQFDELSKSLAKGMSRRQALRWIGGVAGAALASLGVGQAAAAPSPCAVFCSFLHGAAHASCVQACKQCGADISRVCVNPAGSVCCPSGQVCCFDCTTNQQRCGVNSTLCPGSCENTCCI
jgi:hypothetical protein